LPAIVARVPAWREIVDGAVTVHDRLKAAAR